MFTNKENKILRKTVTSTNDISSENVPPLLVLLVVIVVVNSISRQQLVSSDRRLERKKYRFENLKRRSVTSVAYKHRDSQHLHLCNS